MRDNIFLVLAGLSLISSATHGWTLFIITTVGVVVASYFYFRPKL